LSPESLNAFQFISELLDPLADYEFFT